MIFLHVWTNCINQTDLFLKTFFKDNLSDMELMERFLSLPPDVDEGKSGGTDDRPIRLENIRCVTLLKTPVIFRVRTSGSWNLTIELLIFSTSWSRIWSSLELLYWGEVREGCDEEDDWPKVEWHNKKWASSWNVNNKCHEKYFWLYFKSILNQTASIKHNVLNQKYAFDSNIKY